MAQIKSEEIRTKTGKTLLVRALDRGDAAAMNAFRLKLSQESENTNHFPGMDLPSLEAASEFLEKQYKYPVNIGLGVFDKEQLIASLGLIVAKPNHPWIKHIGSFGMGVLKEFWGQGVGTHLLRTQDNYARKSGVLRIEATVRAFNDRAINLYKRNGHKVEGIRKKAVIINGKVYDELFIAKLLDEEN